MSPSEPSPSAQLAAFMLRFPPKTVALGKKCLLWLRRKLPGAIQLVYDYNHSVVVAFGMSEQGIEAVFALAIYPKEVRLYVPKATADPKGLLQGSAGMVRFVVVESASYLDHKDIQALFKAAIKESGVKFPGTGPGRMVIKTGSKKKPKKAKKAKKAA